MQKYSQNPHRRFHVVDAEMFTSAAEVSHTHRTLASSPLVATITACSNLLYLKIGGIDELFGDLLVSALKSCTKLRHFAFRNMSSLFRFSWPVLIDLCCKLPVLNILQLTGAFRESTEPWPCDSLQFPRTLRGIHLTHTRTTDDELDRVLSMAPLGFTFLALSRPTPGLTYPGLLRLLERHGQTLSQLHLSEPTCLPNTPMQIHGRHVSAEGPMFILDSALVHCPRLLHLQIRGPHISSHGLKSFPPSLISLDVATSRYVRPEWLIAGMLKTGKDFKYLRLGCKDMGWSESSWVALFCLLFFRSDFLILQQ